MTCNNANPDGGLLIEILHLLWLIEIVGYEIGETCYDDRDACLRAFGLGAAIQTAAKMAAERVERVLA